MYIAVNQYPSPHATVVISSGCIIANFRVLPACCRVLFSKSDTIAVPDLPTVAAVSIFMCVAWHLAHSSQVVLLEMMYV